MNPNLEALRQEIPEYLESLGLAVFRGYSRLNDDTPTVMWDAERFPDYRAFAKVAQKLAIPLIVFRDQEFYEALVETSLEDLDDAELSYEERRDYERRLREFRNYAGFTCSIEMTFDFEGAMYCFELRTDWYKEFQRISNEVNQVAEDGGDEDESPLGGYFSRN
jgi:hypothetical protein